jgi:hypothetical protein
VSLSQEPAFSVLKNELVCGFKDISRESYAGFSGKHDVGGKAINTTNGAGPTNLQTFILSSDGTVLTCLPGYWHPADLVREIEFAGRLHDVWTNSKLTSSQKNNAFRTMHLAHVDEHPVRMVARSRMQSFDMEHEVKHNLNQSDTIIDRGAASAILSEDKYVKHSAMRAFKTTDRIMHERMASRPFLAYTGFDTTTFAKYGRPLYDKNEDFRDEKGRFVENGRVVDKPPEAVKQKELIGKVPDQILKRRERMKSRQESYGWGQTYQNQEESRGWGQSQSREMEPPPER